MAKTNEQQRVTEARDTYNARRNEIARLIDVLGMELDRQDEEAKNDAKPCWGKVADLEKIRGDLIQAVAFISNKDPEEVEAFLAD